MERLVQVHRPTMELLKKAILVLGALAAVVASGSPPTIYDEVDFDHGHDGSGVWERQQTSQTDLWVVQVGHGDGGGGLAGAEDVGRRLGLRVVGHIKGFPGHFLMERVSSVGPEAEDRPPARLTTRNLEAHGQVVRALQMFPLTRVKRAADQTATRPRKRMGLSSLRASLLARSSLDDVAQQFSLSRLRARTDDDPEVDPSGITFNDQLFRSQWYMDGPEPSSGADFLDVDVLSVYGRNVTGRGVRSVVLDDGLDYTHPDLRANYDPALSWDYNRNRSDPAFKADAYHGTKCAGVIAMVANNSLCGVGVAFDSKVGGVTLLNGVVTDGIEAQALSHEAEKVDIYIASWGPTDDGKTMEGPGKLSREAIIKGITKGRGGKGSIYVWASGNGGYNEDHCSCDGYVASIFTIAIGSVTEKGSFPGYGEMCPSLMAVTFSSGSIMERQIVTVEANGQCTEGFTGTSAAAPLAAGLIALCLQVNPNLTWRDVQYLILLSAVKVNPKDGDWMRNGAGVLHSPKFGFGLLKATAMVHVARNFGDSVGLASLTRSVPVAMPSSNVTIRSVATIQFSVKDPAVKFLEHVEVVTSLNLTYRGCLEISLASPSGTVSDLLKRRLLDMTSPARLLNWKLMSVQFWGENPAGLWTMTVSGDQFNSKCKEMDLEFGNLELILFGTEEEPEVFRRLKKDHPL